MAQKQEQRFVNGIVDEELRSWQGEEKESLENILASPGLLLQASAAYARDPEYSNTRSAACMPKVKKVKIGYRIPAWPEVWECRWALNYQTGELKCRHVRRHAPGKLCRNFYCPHGREMANRISRVYPDAPVEKLYGEA